MNKYQDMKGNPIYFRDRFNHPTTFRFAKEHNWLCKRCSEGWE